MIAAKFTSCTTPGSRFFEKQRDTVCQGRNIRKEGLLDCCKDLYTKSRRSGAAELLMAAAATPSYAWRGPVGVVIAHPDDESMFFAPTLTALKRRGQRAAVLCLSSGTHSTSTTPHLIAVLRM